MYFRTLNLTSAQQFVRLILVGCLLLCVIFSNRLHAQSLPSTVNEALQRADVPEAAVGVAVLSLSEHDPAALLDWQSDVPMSPASTIKLVTSFAALDTLGPNYTWKTRVFRNGPLSGDVLKGDLILQGGGDPHLVIENFWLLLRQIRAQGIREIQGSLIIDSSWMEPQQADAASFDGYPFRPYNVGPAALLVNFGALELKLQTNDDKLRVDALTPIALESVSNVSIVAGACGEWRDKLSPVFSMQGGQIHLILNGTYARSCGTKSWLLQPYPLSNENFVSAIFRSIWREVGGQFDGDMKTQQGHYAVGSHAGVDADAAVLVSTYQSEPLADVLRKMNKFSNNVMTRQVLLTLDSEQNHGRASVVRAAGMMQDWFEKLGMPFTGIQFENGSGLSRTERISAMQMGLMLQHAYRSSLMPELMSTLPILGVDGTMQKRASGLSVSGHAHLKSGTLEGVRNIAGFVLAASGRRYVVVFFVNHKNASHADAAQDLLLQWIYEHG